MPESFYLPEGDTLLPTELTRGPWDADAQHGGPPSALAARALERCTPREDWRLVRVAVDILSPVPLEPLRAEVRVVRPGLNVELLEARVTLAGGRALLRAAGWRIRTTELDVEVDDGPAPPPPEEGREGPFFPGAPEVGYHTGVDIRFLEGGFNERGPARAWLRMRNPLVAGEEPSPWQRVMVAADAGNGLSSVVASERYVYINTDLAVHLFRPFEGSWVHMHSTTYLSREGVGLAETVIADLRGPAGRGTQTLFVRERPDPARAPRPA